MGFKASKYFPIEATLIFILLTTTSIALEDDADTMFLNCLDKESSNNYPTSKVTYTQQNSSFLSVLDALAWNKRFVQRSDIRRPFVIVTAKNESDVRATLFCSKRYSLQMRIRGGGHDMEGTSYISDVPFVILDMLNMQSIDINMEEESASVQAGAVLGEVYYAVAQKSPVHAFPGGVCPTVGVVGHFSGGGYGNLMREYGLSTDHVVDARLMDVDGNILDRKSMGEDLFWAIRGGGAASFGIILSWKVNLVRVPPLVTVFQVTRAIDTTIVTKWQEIAPNLPKKAFVRLRVSVLNDKENKQNRHTNNTRLVLSFIGMFLGQTNELINMLNETFPELKLSPRECIEMPWVNSTLFWVDAPNGTPLEFLTSRQYERVARKVKSDFVVDPIPREGLDKMFTKLLEMDGLVMEWNPYGGKMSEISENSTAYPYRAGILYKIEYDFKWYEKGVDAEKYHVDLSKRMYDFMTPYVSKSPRKAFFNYRDFDVGTNHGNHSSTGFGTTYYGPNFLRLVKVKTDVDPGNFFRYEQSIPPITLL